MHREMDGRRLELVQGDITVQQVDAVVNAANSRLAGGGGVDGAIHRKGGPEIIRETAQRYPDGCPTGSAVISGAGNLPAKYVIHAVGPVFRGGSKNEASLLAATHRQCLQLALDHDCTSIAFPAISCGVYGYPLDQASRIALSVAKEFLSQHDQLQLVRFVLFDEQAFSAFADALRDL